MIRETLINSALSFEWYSQSGQLSDRVMDILRVMWGQLPMNQRQIAFAVRDLPHHSTISDRAIQPRVVTMERMGLLRPVESKPDPVTGRLSMFYELTYERPIMTLAEASQMGSRRNIRALEKEIAALKSENETLRAQLAETKKIGQLTFL